MSIALPCNADFEILSGSVPRNISVTKVHVSFAQGEEMARLLRQSKELTLVFDENGQLIAVEQ